MTAQIQKQAEENLLVLYRDGDDEAYRKLFESHYPSILNLCYRIIGTREDAEEVAQDVFIKVHQSIQNYTPRGKESTFLYRIAVNLSLNRIRDKKRKRLLSFDLLKQDRGFEIKNDEAFNPDRILERKEIREAIWQAINTLPENQKTAVILKRFHDLSYEEIAEITQCSVSAVEARLHRARQTLKKKLDRILD